MEDGIAHSINSVSAEQTVFARALRCSDPEDRAACLNELCGDDHGMRLRVEALLRASAHAGNFLTDPPTALFHGLDDSLETASLNERPGDRIGQFRLLEQIGQGGCGVVYMAEQESPVRRRVALKIIKLGMDTRSVVARFEAERQALALMDHPHIARVFDGGATPTGRPFFAMELVRGVRLTEYCESTDLPLVGRLRLFVQVCRAIQHAHQKGLIHRDLKPSNILVSVDNGEPVPKVIDFGIAKAINQRLTEKTLFTHFHAFIGTPAYTSPEQAELTSMDVDTRSDIYSLGVLLYELLTGRTPFDGERLMSSGLDEMRRIIRDEEPARPSSVATGGRPLVEGSEGPAPRPLKAVPPDLDWIVLKCLEKDRTRRYDTANDLASDIERHLADEPVQARPPSFGYRAGKWFRRHRGAALGALAVVVALGVGLVIATVMYWRERQAWAAESAQRVKAEAERAKSAQTARFLTQMLSEIDPDTARGADVTLLTALLEKVAQRVENELKDQPEVEASVRAVVGHVYRALGQYPEAEPHLAAALAIRQRLLGLDHPETLDCLLKWVDLRREQGRLDDADARCRQGLAASHRSFGPHHPLSLAFQERLTFICLDGRKFAEAESIQSELLAATRRIRGVDEIDVLKARSGLASIYLQQRKFAEAEPIFREVVAGLREKLDPTHPGLMQEMANWAASLLGLGRLAEAEKIYVETWAIAERVFGQDHPISLITLQNMGTLYSRQGDHAKAESTLRQACSLARQSLGAEHPRTLRMQEALTLALGTQGKTAEAVTIARATLETAERIFGPDHPRTLKSATHLADALARSRESWPEARSRYEGVLVAQRRLLGPTHGDSLLTAGNLLLVLRAANDWPAAETLCRESVAQTREHLGAAHPVTAEWMEHWAEVQEQLKPSAIGEAPGTSNGDP